jgi:hypothetical protein
MTITTLTILIQAAWVEQQCQVRIIHSAVLSNIHTFGSNTVNEARFGFTRLDNKIGIPKGGVGVTLQNQGMPTYGIQGNARRRMLYGPGIDNFDMALHKTTKLGEGKTLELRLEAFNVFNHAQFYGASSVDGNIGDKNVNPNNPYLSNAASPGTFGYVTKAADPRIGQIAAKFVF